MGSSYPGQAYQILQVSPACIIPVFPDPGLSEDDWKGDLLPVGSGPEAQRQTVPLASWGCHPLQAQREREKDAPRCSEVDRNLQTWVPRGAASYLDADTSHWQNPDPGPSPWSSHPLVARRGKELTGELIPAGSLDICVVLVLTRRMRLPQTPHPKNTVVPNKHAI